MAEQSHATPLDRDAIIAGLQDQIDELTTTVEAQQRHLEALTGLLTRLAARSGLTLPPAGGH